ncbi:unnamed protein product [Rotaria sordida]|uniref:Microbial-type PARG catalytic domain-containing protein n=1 Tax=Rotaria sordida TaxID=392033 RepID=A0A814EL78_9BILA|nr:unnamed protein product [Rotaria sordida]CAF1180909.1 unnamed protein product [Rotaria sordida]
MLYKGGCRSSIVVPKTNLTLIELFNKNGVLVTDRGSSSVEPERASSSLETECGSSSSSVKPKCGSSSSLEAERDDSECEIISTGKNHKSLNVLTDQNCISVIDEGTEKRCATSARSAHRTKYLSQWKKKIKIHQMRMTMGNNNKNMLHRSSVFVPFESLTQQVIESVVSVATTSRKPGFDYGEQSSTGIDQQAIQHAQNVQQWLVDITKQPLNWVELEEKYSRIADRNCDEMARFYGSNTAEPYFELKVKTRHADVLQSREYMKKFRKNGFDPKELKLYWNVKQIENLCPESRGKILYDPSDEDAVENLRQYPVSERNHNGIITYITNGIEKAVFDVPENAQVILLNFANEQSPGGGYLRHAQAQEEVLLYNSDGYRALLDLKYGRMNGGYAIPEFGLAYVRNIRIFKSPSSNECQKADMLVSACYCMGGRELYQNPRNRDDWENKNLAKFRAFIAAAVANTIGDGKNTYLLLGPIGTGAFGNDVKRIGEVFCKALNSPMMGSKGSIRHAFEHIWFVSIHSCKNEEFKKIFDKDEFDNN